MAFTRKQKRQILERQHYCCAGCGLSFSPNVLEDNVVREDGRIVSRPAVEFDHKLRRNAGGKDTVKNGQALCVPCHKKKTFGTPHRRRGTDNYEARKTARMKRKHEGTWRKPKRKIAKRKNPWPPKGSRKLQSRKSP